MIVNGKLEVCAVYNRYCEVSFRGTPLVLVACYHPPSSDNISKREWSLFFPSLANAKFFLAATSTLIIWFGNPHTYALQKRLFRTLYNNQGCRSLTRIPGSDLGSHFFA